MKKLSILFFVMLCAGALWGQGETEKRKIAVYLTATENVESEVKRLINNQIITALTRTNRYTLIERNDIFVQQIDKERVTQLSGRVSDNQITKLGEGYGAVAVCIVDVGSLKGELSVDMRMVSVEKETIIRSGSADGHFSGISDIRKIVDLATADMLEGSSSTSSNTPSGGNTNNTPTNTPQKLTVGMSYQGGIIAYIDATGQHGLIAAPQDQSADIQWYDGNYIVTGATGTAIGTGKSNTKKIVQKQGSGNYAAKLCDDLVLNGYDDWYLPSKDELNELYKNKYLIGGFSTKKDFYWSSSEHNFNNAWLQYFNDGSQYYYFKYYTYRVRAVRAF